MTSGACDHAEEKVFKVPVASDAKASKMRSASLNHDRRCEQAQFAHRLRREQENTLPTVALTPAQTSDFSTLRCL